jgi:hypothetical protein
VVTCVHSGSLIPAASFLCTFWCSVAFVVLGVEHLGVLSLCAFSCSAYILSVHLVVLVLQVLFLLFAHTSPL